MDFGRALCAPVRPAQPLYCKLLQAIASYCKHVSDLATARSLGAHRDILRPPGQVRSVREVCAKCAQGLCGCRAQPLAHARNHSHTRATTTCRARLATACTATRDASRECRPEWWRFDELAVRPCMADTRPWLAFLGSWRPGTLAVRRLVVRPSFPPDYDR